jgi:hypothetical protein
LRARRKSGASHGVAGVDLEQQGAQRSARRDQIFRVEELASEAFIPFDEFASPIEQGEAVQGRRLGVVGPLHSPASSKQPLMGHAPGQSRAATMPVR